MPYTTVFKRYEIKYILTYEVVLRDPAGEKEMIDRLRERNGNLEITVSRQETGEQRL